MTVLSLLVLMISTVMNSASLTMASTNKHLNADDQARMVFDRMQMDLTRMLRRSDVYFQFTKLNGNDQCTFYSETPGYFPTSTSTPLESNVSLISYQFNPAYPYQLERLSQGCQWTEIAFTPSTSGTFSTTNPTHVLSNAVFRMELAFLEKVSDTSFQITTTAPTPGSQAFQSCYGIMVAIAVLDPTSQKMMTAGNYTTLIAALPDYIGTQTISLSTTSSPTAATIDPIVSSWQTALNASTFAQTAGVSAAAARQVRIYQRIIYLQ